MSRRSPFCAALAALCLGLGMAGGAAPPAAAAPGKPVAVDLVDDQATPATRSLFAHLMEQRGSGILFGHEETLGHGFTFEEVDGVSSDVKAAVNDHPAVFGWDTLILDGGVRPGVAGGTEAENIEKLSWAIEQADRLGGINTVAAHLPNFVTGGDFYDTSGRVVSQILPGGDKHADYNAFLDRIAAALSGAQRADGTAIPVIFRPFHEQNGSWFWWGAGHRTTSEYIALWRYTVTYLRDTKGVHNLLYAYSPNAAFDGRADAYLQTYPGDEFVDVLGYDAYDSTGGTQQWLDATVTDLAMIVRLANERGKVPAFTEFGEAHPEGTDPTWFTDLLSAIKADRTARQITWMLTWANFGGSNRAYVPYPATADRPAHPMLPDFVAFHDDDFTVFAAQLSDPYGVKAKAAKNEPFMALLTPTDRTRVTTTSTVVRALVTGKNPASVTFSVDGGAPRPMQRDAAGFWSAEWTIDPSWLDNRSVTLTVVAKLQGRLHTDSALVLLGEVAPLPAGWVDDFEGYAGDDVTLTEAYGHINTNTTTHSTEHKRSGRYGLAYGYDLSGAGYTGISKTVDQDWSGFSSLSLWVRGDGTANGLTVQVVAGGVYFEAEVPLADTQGRDVALAFDAFAPAPWDTANAGAVLDDAHLRSISQVNLYVGQGVGAPSTGTIHVDDIRAS